MSSQFFQKKLKLLKIYNHKKQKYFQILNFFDELNKSLLLFFLFYFLSMMIKIDGFQQIYS